MSGQGPLTRISRPGIDEILLVDYDHRTAVERVNSRIDRVFGFEDHFIRGKAKMEMRVSLALAVLLAMAIGHIRANQADLMRSLTKSVRKTGS